MKRKGQTGRRGIAALLAALMLVLSPGGLVQAKTSEILASEVIAWEDAEKAATASLNQKDAKIITDATAEETAPESGTEQVQENDDQKKAPFVSTGKTLVIAHRGASTVAPEDTIAAFLEAKRLGADGYETDIQITKDGKLVAQHNYTIDGNSNGSGYVHDLTLEELKTFDFGAWKDERYKGETIATVEECLAKAGNFQVINLEIKAPQKMRDVYVQEFAAALEKSGLTDRIIVSSFDAAILKELKELAPDVRTGLLTVAEMSFLYIPLVPLCIPTDKPVNEIKKEELKIPGFATFLMSIGIRGATPEDVGMELLGTISGMFPGATWDEISEEILKQRELVSYVDSLDFQPDYLHCEFGALLRIPELVDEMHKRGIGVNVWTPNTESELTQAFAFHPDGVITDEPALALQIRREKSTAQLQELLRRILDWLRNR